MNFLINPKLALAIFFHLFIKPLRSLEPLPEGTRMEPRLNGCSSNTNGNSNDLPTEVIELKDHTISKIKPTSSTEETSTKKKYKPGFIVRTLDEISNQYKRIPWLIDSVISAASVNFIYGNSNCGKTYFALHLAYAVAKGELFFGHKTVQQEVLYICLEGPDGFAQRCLAAKETEGSTENLKVVTGQFNLTRKDDVLQLLNAHKNAKLIIVDTLNQATSGQDENSSSIASAIKEHFIEFLNAGGSLVILHHTGKGESSDMRGSSSLIGMADTTISVKKKGETSVWRTEKMRDSKSGIQHGFVIEDRTFETDSYEIITKGVLVPLPDDYISETEPPSETKSKPQGRNYSLLCPFITKSLREAGNIDSEDVIVNRCIGLMLEMDSKGTAKRKTVSPQRTHLGRH